MITNDQPTIFSTRIIAAVSSAQDGDMGFGRESSEQTVQNRYTFLAHAGINIRHTTLVRVTYDTNDFARYRIVDETHQSVGMTKPESDIIADALVTTTPNHALFLPLADCVGVILHDEKQNILMVSHVGRHSAEIEGARKSVEYLKANFSTNPANVKVWLSPAVGKATYPLHKFNGKSLHEVITQQLQAAGVLSGNIQASTVDTAHNKNYFSHSQFNQGNREFDGRFAIVAMMTGQGEPA